METSKCPEGLRSPLVSIAGSSRARCTQWELGWHTHEGVQGILLGMCHLFRGARILSSSRAGGSCQAQGDLVWILPRV